MRIGFLCKNRFGKYEENEPVNATIEFNDFTLPAIRKLEKMAGSPDHLFRYMVCRKIQTGFMPVCMIEKNGLNNFFFNEFL